MTCKERKLTSEENEVTKIFDALLLASCTTKEQEQQMLKIIQKRKQKEKLCAKPTTVTHSYKTI